MARRPPVSQFGLSQTSSGTAVQMRDSLLGMQAALARVEDGMRGAFAQCVSELAADPVAGPAVRDTIEAVQAQLQRAAEQRAAEQRAAAAPSRRSTSAGHGAIVPPAAAVPGPSRTLAPPPAIKAPSGRGHLLVLVCEARNMPLPPSWAAAPGGGSRRPSWLRLGSEGGEGGVPSWAVGAASLPPALLRLDKATAHPTLQVSLGVPSSGAVTGISSKGLTGYFPPGRGHTAAPEQAQFQESSLAEDAPQGWCSLWNEVTRVQLDTASTAGAGAVLNVCVHITPPASPADRLSQHTVGGSPYPESAQGQVSASDAAALCVGTVVGRAALNIAACRKWPWQPHACWLDVAAGAALTPPSQAAAPAGGASASSGTPPSCPVFDASRATGTPSVVPMFRVATAAGARGVVLPSDASAATAGKPAPPCEPPMPVHNLTYALQQQQLASLRGDPALSHETVSQLPSAQRWAAPELPPLPAGGTPTVLLQTMWVPEEDSSHSDVLNEPHWFLPRDRASAAVAAAHEGHPLRRAVASALRDELNCVKRAVAAAAGTSVGPAVSAGGVDTPSDSGRLVRGGSVSSHLSGLSDVSMDARVAGKRAATPGSTAGQGGASSPPPSLASPSSIGDAASHSHTEDTDSPLHVRRRAASDMPERHAAAAGAAGGGSTAELKKKLHFMAEAYRKLQKKEAAAAAKLQAAEKLLKQHGLGLE